MNLRTIFMVILLILAIGGLFSISLKKDTPVLTVNVTLAPPSDGDSSRIISHVDATLSFARRMEIPGNTPLSMPGITVLVIQNMHEVSGWYSTSIPKSGSIYGNYSLTVGLTDKFDPNQPVRVLTRVVDPNGIDLSVKAVDITLT